MQKKCELYWPDKTGETCRYGRVEVRNESKFTHGTFLKRTFTVRHLDIQVTSAFLAIMLD